MEALRLVGFATAMLSAMTAVNSVAHAETSVFNRIIWYGHDTFCIKGSDKIIYTDPYQLDHEDKADIVLVSHGHSDHCSKSDIDRISGPDTVIAASKQCAGKLDGNAVFMEPGDVKVIGGIKIEAVPAYNINKRYHPKSDKGIGFIVTVDGEKIYFAGDTDKIPEMGSFNADIGLLPVSGTYVMIADEAAKAALDIGLKYAIPMHYGSIVGSAEDAERFAESLKGKVEVRIPKKQ